MSEQKSDATDSATSSLHGTVALAIDYSNGATRSFTSIPWTKETDVFGVLEAAASIKPGLTFEFNVTLVSDRAGRQRGFIASVDGVTADQTNRKWLLWINDRCVGNELATKGAFAPGTQVHGGDILLLKIVANEG